MINQKALREKIENYHMLIELNINLLHDAISKNLDKKVKYHNRLLAHYYEILVEGYLDLL